MVFPTISVIFAFSWAWCKQKIANFAPTRSYKVLLTSGCKSNVSKMYLSFVNWCFVQHALSVPMIWAILIYIYNNIYNIIDTWCVLMMPPLPLSGTSVVIWFHLSICLLFCLVMLLFYVFSFFCFWPMLLPTPPMTGCRIVKGGFAYPGDPQSYAARSLKSSWQV